jgi:7,8-dihydro-6-hydroxymethylpterin-pyrophosphokinase
MSRIEELVNFDPVTGRQNDEVLSYRMDDQHASLIEAASAYRTMANGKGWQQLEAWINDVVAELQTKLENEYDLEKVRRWQETIKAYRTIRDYPKFIAYEADRIVSIYEEAAVKR